MESQRETEDYVTIVSVGNSDGEVGSQHILNGNQSMDEEEPFVTVLSIGRTPATEEEVTIYRLPGEKLGFGLKFEGGIKSAECVRRLFIQSCTSDSPAGRARASWGPLQAGDEILRIDNVPVTALTRLECVRCLKDSNVAVTLLVRHDVLNGMNAQDGFPDISSLNDSDINKQNFDKMLPPPVPPRKIPRKHVRETESKNFSDFKNFDGNLRNGDTVISEVTGHSKKISVSKYSPGRPRRPAPVPMMNTPPPPEAQVYTDLFCHEKEHGIHVAESESDDTGSSISTVIDRLSVYSSFPGSVENSIPSTPTLGSKQLNMHSVFSCLDSIGQSLMNDMPPSIVEEKIKTPKSPANNINILEKITLTKTKSNVSEENNNKQTEDTVSRELKSKEKNNEIVRNCDSNFEEFVVNKDSNNNKNFTKENNEKNSSSNFDSVDFVDHAECPLKYGNSVEIIEPPKPKPRNIIRKSIDTTFGDRKYDESLSLTKIHCIESWLQDSISCSLPVENPSDVHEEESELIRPEALPRLIDFVPKSHVSKNQLPSDNQEKLSSHEVIKPASDTCDEDSNDLRLIIPRDSCSDWCNGGTSPQLETIYEDLATCPTLLIEESSRHPPAGDSGSDQGTHPEETRPTNDIIKDCFVEPPDIKIVEVKVVEEDISLKEKGK